MTRKALTARIGALALAGALSVSQLGALAYYDYQLPQTTITAAESLCSLYINNTHISVKPYYEGSTLMLPLRAITDRAGWTYDYTNGTVTFGREGHSKYKLNIGVNAYPMSGGTQSLEYAPALIDNHTYVPWFFIERLGFKVTNNPDGRIDVKVTKSSTGSSESTAANEDNLSVYVNGHRAGSAFYKGKTLMIPLRAVTERLGYSYSYSNSGKYSVFSAKGINTYIYWNKNSYPIDNKYKKLERSPSLKNGTLYVPLSYATKALKCSASITTSGKLKLSR